MNIDSLLQEPAVVRNTIPILKYDRKESINDIFSRQAELYPERIAVELWSFSRQPYSGREIANALTFRELEIRSNQLATDLARHGVGAGARVGISLDRGLDLIVSLLGILKIGGAYVPLDANYPEAHLAKLANDANLTLAISDRKHAPYLRRILKCPVICLDEDRHALATAHQGPPVSISNPDGASLAYILFTSGSTGEPKGVCIPHCGVTRLVVDTNYVDLGESETVLQLAPLSFDASTFEIWAPLLTGGKLILFPPGLPQLDQIARVVREAGITTMWLTAGLFHRMVEQHPAGLQPLRQLLAGGDVLSARHLKLAFAACPGLTIINGYGPTECTTFAACHPMHRAGDVEERVPIGKPIAQTSVFILKAASGDELLPVRPGQLGEICIGGDGLALGYLGDPALTAAKFIYASLPGHGAIRLYRTGDQGRMREDGTIEFHGRIDTQVKISGHRVEPAEVESTMRSHDLVEDAAVVATHGERGDRRLAAFVVLRPGTEDAQRVPDALRTYLQASLPAFMVPSFIRILNQLPLNANGKIDRHALETEITIASASDTPSLSSDTESRIAAIWQRVLEVAAVPRDANFFDLGGDSLLLIEVHAEMQRAGFRAFSITDLFAFPTVAALAAQLSASLAPQAVDDNAVDAAAKRRARERLKAAQVADAD